jgi:hypothetical protein
MTFQLPSKPIDYFLVLLLGHAFTRVIGERKYIDALLKLRTNFPFFGHIQYEVVLQYRFNVLFPNVSN